MMELEKDSDTIATTIAQWMHDILTRIGISDQWISYVRLIVLLVILVFVLYALQFCIRYILTFVFRRTYKITNLSFFKYTIKNRLPHFLALAI